MSQNFHERFEAEKVKPPSERSTGLVFSVVALLIAFWLRHDAVLSLAAIAAAAVLAGLSYLSPRVLRPLNIAWFWLGLLLHRIMNPLVMFALFAVVFVPAGSLMRLWHDPLRRRRAPDASSYWAITDKAEPSPGAMVNQF